MPMYIDSDPRGLNKRKKGGTRWLYGVVLLLAAAGVYLFRGGRTAGGGDGDMAAKVAQLEKGLEARELQIGRLQRALQSSDQEKREMKDRIKGGGNSRLREMEEDLQEKEKKITELHSQKNRLEVSHRKAAEELQKYMGEYVHKEKVKDHLKQIDMLQNKIHQLKQEKGADIDCEMVVKGIKGEVADLQKERDEVTKQLKDMEFKYHQAVKDAKQHEYKAAQHHELTKDLLAQLDSTNTPPTKEDTGKLKTLDDVLKRFHALRDRYGKEDDEIVYKPSDEDDEDDDYDEDGSSPGPPPVWAPIPDIRLRKNATNAMNGTATSGSPLPAA